MPDIDPETIKVCIRQLGARLSWLEECQDNDLKDEIEETTKALDVLDWGGG